MKRGEMTGPEEVIARLERRLVDAVADSLAEVVRDIQSGK